MTVTFQGRAEKSGADMSQCRNGQRPDGGAETAYVTYRKVLHPGYTLAQKGKGQSINCIVLLT